MWRHVWFVAKEDTRLMFRERSTLIWVFLMPVLFFYFIGTLTSGILGSLPSGKQTLHCRHGQETGFLAEHLDRRLAENHFAVARADGGQSDAADGAARLTIPDGFDAKLRRGEKVVLQFAAAGEGTARDLELLRVQRAAYTVLADVIAAKRLSGEVNRKSVQAISETSPSLTLRVEAAGRRQTVPSGFEHAIPGELVMFTMLVTVTSGSMLVLAERKQGLLRRLAATPISRGQIVLGKWLGKMILGLVQIGVGIVIATVLFQMNWGPAVSGRAYRVGRVGRILRIARSAAGQSGSVRGPSHRTRDTRKHGTGCLGRLLVADRNCAGLGARSAEGTPFRLDDGCHAPLDQFSS